MEPIRTALIHNIVTPYRTVFFDALSDHDAVDLHVFYCAESHQNRNWPIPDQLGHKHTYLKGLMIERSDVPFHVNPGVVTKLVQSDFDVTVVGGTTNLTMQLGFLASKANCDGTVLWTERIRPPVNFMGKLVWPLLRTFANRADSLIVPTSTAQRFQEAQGVQPQQIFIAPNIVDNSKYYSNDDDSGPVRLLFVGQLIERKGISYLIDAYETIDDTSVELVIVGDGLKRDDYERQMRRRKLDVTFTGWVSEERKREAFANADLFVLPSLEDLAPLVLNEALASGLPILTTEGVGNAPDMIIEGGNGYVVPTADADALAECLSDLLSDPGELRRMGERSQRISDERFSPAMAADRFVDAIRASVTD